MKTGQKIMAKKFMKNISYMIHPSVTEYKIWILFFFKFGLLRFFYKPGFLKPISTALT